MNLTCIREVAGSLGLLMHIVDLVAHALYDEVIYPREPLRRSMATSKVAPSSSGWTVGCSQQIAPSIWIVYLCSMVYYIVFILRL